MANKAQQTLRFVNFVNQQLEFLKKECDTVKVAADECTIQVQSEVDTWANGGQVNQTTCDEILNRIHQSITFFIAKSVELSGIHNNEKLDEPNLTPMSNIHESTNKTVSQNQDVEKSYLMLRRKEVSDVATEKSIEEIEANISKKMTMKLAILEEAVFSLKKTTEQVQEKQENVDRTIKDVLTQQENVTKKCEISIKSNLNFKKKIQKTVSELEKKSKNISTNVDNLYESVKKFDDKFNSLKEENSLVKVSMNETNKQLRSVRSCSNDAFMSMQDLSMSIKGTNQHYNEMSNKMNQLETSINLMSTQYTKQIEKMSRIKKDKCDNLIGMTCNLLAKRLIPLEELRENLTEINTRKPLHLKVDDLTSQVMELSKKLSETSNNGCDRDYMRKNSQHEPQAGLTTYDNQTIPSSDDSQARFQQMSKTRAERRAPLPKAGRRERVTILSPPESDLDY